MLKVLLKTIITIIIFYSCSSPSKKSTSIHSNVKIKTTMENINHKFEKLNDSTPSEFDPIFITEIANEFIPLGKKEILSSIDSYYQSNKESSDHFGLFLLLRIIFEVPKMNSYPDIKIGKFDFGKPKNENEIRQFPIMFSNELPFLIVSSYYLGGFPESLDTHIQFYEESGILRENIYKLEITLSEEKLFNDLRKGWCEKYQQENMPEELMAFTKAQIKRAISSASSLEKGSSPEE